MDPLFLDVLKKEVVEVLRQDMNVMRQDIRQDMNVMRQDIRQDMDVMRQDIVQVRVDIAAVDKKLEHHIVTTGARFDSVDEQLGEAREMTQNLASHVDVQLKEIRAEMATKADLQRFVTKDYLDDKLADLRSDLIMMARKGNKKLEAFVEELVSEKRLPRAAARRILLLEPFPAT